MEKKKVALVGIDAPEVPQWVVDELDKKGLTLVHHHCTDREQLEKYASDAQIVWLYGGSKILKDGNLDACKEVWGIIRSGSGTDNVPVDQATEKGIVVANTPGAIAEQVAEHTIGLLFAVIRQIPIHDRLVRQGIWDRMRGWPNWHLRGQNLGLIAFGNIAQLTAKKMGSFEMNLLVYDPFIDQKIIEDAGGKPVDLPELLKESDFVSIHCPLNEKTRGLLGEKELKMMKPTAVLINASRGEIVPDDILAKALKEGWISAAGADVMVEEPPSPDNPLLQCDNFVITPHIGAYSDLYYDTLWHYGIETADDLANGRWPRSYVNPQVKPRWPFD